MPPKKDKKGKKKGKSKIEEDQDKYRVTEVDRTFYELILSDARKKIAHLRSYLADLEDSNAIYTEETRSLLEDRKDAVAELKDLEAKQEEDIEYYEEELIDMKKWYEHQRINNAKRISDMQAKYDAMYKQLGSEIKILNGRLNSVTDYISMAQSMFELHQDEKIQMEEQERIFRAQLQELQLKLHQDKESFKKDVRDKLLAKSEEFMREGEARKATYARRLVRENIGLEKEIEKLHLQRKELNAEIAALDKEKAACVAYTAGSKNYLVQLLYTSKENIMVVDVLTKEYEALLQIYKKNKKFRHMYDRINVKRTCERAGVRMWLNKLRKKEQLIECAHLEANIEMAEERKEKMQFENLGNLMLKLKKMVELAIRRCEDGQPSAKELAAQGLEHWLHKQKYNLLVEMNALICEGARQAHTPSIESISEPSSAMVRAVVARSQPSLMEFFIKTAKTTSTEEISDEDLQQELSRIIPQEHLVDENVLMDVEIGEPLVYSSDRSDIDIMYAGEEEQAPEEEQESSSSDDDFELPDDKSLAALSTTERVPNMMPETAPLQPPKAVVQAHPDVNDDDEVKEVQKSSSEHELADVQLGEEEEGNISA